MDGDIAFDDVEERLAAEALIVDVDGFEGPLDLLLMLSLSLDDRVAHDCAQGFDQQG
jgi:hypothetical protein